MIYTNINIARNSLVRGACSLRSLASHSTPGMNKLRYRRVFRIFFSQVFCNIAIVEDNEGTYTRN